MRFLAIAMFIFAAVNTHAEERCLPADTPRQCVQRLITTRAYENAQAALAATNPGTSTVASPVRSAVKDFLSAASAQIEGSSVKDSGAALIIDYSFLKQLNLEATFPNPTPSPADASVNPVEQLSRGDDVLVTFSYNLLTRHFGRNVDKPLFDSMLLALISNTAPATAAVPANAYDTPFVQLLPDTAARVTAMAEYETAVITALPAVASQLGTDLAKLANNQPQLFASGLYHRRAAPIGPDEHGFRTTWEIGTDNLNTFRSEEGRDCETRGDCLAAFTNFVAKTAKRHRTGRLALAIQYGKTALNNDGVVSEVATKGFTYMATYGQEISSFTGQPARFDLSYTYDGMKAAHSFTTTSTSLPRNGSPLAQFEFGVGGIPIPPSTIHDSVGLTFTQPIVRNLSVPISVISVDHDDWTLAPRQEAAPNYAPAHRRRRETEYHVAIRYQIPPFPRPPQHPACCCK